MVDSTVIAERFQLEGLAGAGGMGSVYRAWDARDGRFVAVKQIHHRAHAARFAREAELLERLVHPGIVRYIAHGETGTGEPFLVMEWLEGESLRACLDRGSLSVREAIGVARRVASALAAAHRAGVVHRDLKPDNVFLVGGSLDRVKLLDFGIARADGAEDELTATGAILGSPGYIAPEQGLRAGTLTPASDVYALGCIVYRSLTGQRPFEGRAALDILARARAEEAPRLRDRVRAVPGALDELVAQMLRRDPIERPANADAIVARLDGIGLVPDEVTRRGRSPSRVPLIVAAAATVAAIAALVAVVAATSPAQPTARPAPTDEPRADSSLDSAAASAPTTALASATAQRSSGKSSTVACPAELCTSNLATGPTDLADMIGLAARFAWDLEDSSVLTGIHAESVVAGLADLTRAPGASYDFRYTRADGLHAALRVTVDGPTMKASRLDSKPAPAVDMPGCGSAKAFAAAVAAGLPSTGAGTATYRGNGASAAWEFRANAGGERRVVDGITCAVK